MLRVGVTDLHMKADQVGVISAGRGSRREVSRRIVGWGKSLQPLYGVGGHRHRRGDSCGGGSSRVGGGLIAQGGPRTVFRRHGQGILGGENEAEGEDTPEHGEKEQEDDGKLDGRLPPLRRPGC